MKYELMTQFDIRKQFYGKAVVEENGNKKELFSYGTKVAVIENGKAKVFGSFSQTTTRHIKEFLKQNDFKAISTQQILNDYFTEK